MQGVKLLTHSSMSVALSPSFVSVSSAHSCVSVALAHSCVSAGGISVGCLSACGAREKKRDIWLRDKASAMPFSLPGTCISAIVKLWLAANRNRRRKRSAICGCFPDFLYQAFTIDSLSQQKQILLPHSHWAHVVAATRMANSSCHWMDFCGSR